MIKVLNIGTPLVIALLGAIGTAMLSAGNTDAGWVLIGLASVLLVVYLACLTWYQLTDKVEIHIEKIKSNHINDDNFELIVQGSVCSWHQDTVSEMNLWINPLKPIKSTTHPQKPGSVDSNQHQFQLHFDITYVNLKTLEEKYNHNPYTPPCILSLDTSKARWLRNISPIPMIGINGKIEAGLTNFAHPNKKTVKIKSNQIIGEELFKGLCCINANERLAYQWGK